jgi:hypothetical protein
MDRDGELPLLRCVTQAGAAVHPTVFFALGRRGRDRIGDHHRGRRFLRVFCLWTWREE